MIISSRENEMDKRNIFNNIFFSDIFDLAVFRALHFKLVPTQYSEETTEISDEDIMTSKPRWRRTNNKKQKFKFSREASYKSTILVLKFGQVFEDEVKTFAVAKRRSKLHFHPIMGVLYNNEEKPDSFLVFCNGSILKTSSFKSMLLLYMEIFHVFDFHYPTEGRLVCELISLCLLDFKVSERACKTAEKLGKEIIEYCNSAN